jgi:hypothetical protein
MDRPDERRDDTDDTEERVRDEAEDRETTLRRRRDEERPGSREVQRTPGATGIDMGGGGSGTDIDRDI